MKVTKSDKELIEMIMMLMADGGFDLGYFYAKGDLNLTPDEISENQRKHARKLMEIIGIKES